MRKIKVMLVALVAACLLAFAGVSAPAFAVAGPPAAQSHTGQPPVGLIGSDGFGGGVYFNTYVVKVGTELATWYGTFGADCFNAGTNDFGNPAYNDGIQRYVCMVHVEYDGSQHVPIGVPKTQFYNTLVAWFPTTQRGANPATERCYRTGISISKNVLVTCFYVV